MVTAATAVAAQQEEESQEGQEGGEDEPAYLHLIKAQQLRFGSNLARHEHLQHRKTTVTHGTPDTHAWRDTI